MIFGSPSKKVMFGIFGYVTDSRPRLCSRPLCAKDAEVLLLFDYDARLVELRTLDRVRDANLLELCADHANRFRPPQGWACEDVREERRWNKATETSYATYE